MSDTDLQLLARYARDGAEDAFSELVRRHVGLVHTAALRQVRSPALAEEITQSVFLDLARQAKQIGSETIVGAWLYAVTRRTAIDVLRRETRRQLREQVSIELNAMNATATDWTHIEPLLDDAMEALDETDRTAVLLRYFENKPLREVGAVLGTSDDAAQKRVSRAVERLREFFAKRGVSVAGSGLTVALSANAVQPAPTRVIAKVCSSTGLAIRTGNRGVNPSARHGPPSGLLKLVGVIALVTCVTILVSRQVFEVPDSMKPQNDGSGQSETNNSGIGVSLPGTSLRIRDPMVPSTSIESKGVRQWIKVHDSADGNALRTAHIRAAYFYAGGRGEGHSVYTDEHGVAGIPQPNEEGVTPGMNVFVIKEGYVPKAIGFGVDAPAEYLIGLDRAVTAGGVVVNEEGDPIPGTRVEAVRSEDYQAGKPNTDFQLTRVETDPNGRWVYPHIPRAYSNAIFQLTCDGYAVTRVSVNMASSEAQNAKFVIQRGHVVQGQVFDPDGVMVFGASVSEVHNFGHRKLRTETDVNGEFVLVGLSANEEQKVVLRVDAPGKASHLQTVRLLSRTNVARIILGHGNVFRGEVLDEEGRPVGGAVVQTDYDFERQIQKQFEWRAETDLAGRFEWDSAPDEPVCYWIEAPGYEVIRGLRKPADGMLHQIILKPRR